MYRAGRKKPIKEIKAGSQKNLKHKTLRKIKTKFLLAVLDVVLNAFKNNATFRWVYHYYCRLSLAECKNFTTIIIATQGAILIEKSIKEKSEKSPLSRPAFCILPKYPAKIRRCDAVFADELHSSFSSADL